MNDDVPFRIILYTAGSCRNSRNALDALRRIVAQWPNGTFALDVIDVLEDSAALREAGILAIPSVVIRGREGTMVRYGPFDDPDALVAVLTDTWRRNVL